MKRKFISAIVTSLILAFVLGTSAFAASGYIEQRFDIPLDQRSVTSNPIQRTTKFQNVQAQCISVRPLSGKDNFENIQANIKDANGIFIGTKGSTYTTLSETNTKPTDFEIKDGSLDLKYVYFSFRGNNPSYAAVAYVSYSSK